MYKLCKIFWSNLEFFTADKPILWKIGNNNCITLHSIRILTHTRSAYTAYTAYAYLRIHLRGRRGRRGITYGINYGITLHTEL
jgi:hypothetical protein